MKKTYRTILVTDAEGRPSLHAPGDGGAPGPQVQILRTILSEFRPGTAPIEVTVTADDGRDDIYRFSVEALGHLRSGAIRGRVTDGQGAEVCILDTQLRSPGHPVAAKVYDGSEEVIRTYSAAGLCSDGNPDHELVILLEKTGNGAVASAPATPAAAPAQAPPDSAGMPQHAERRTPAQIVRDLRSRYPGFQGSTLDLVTAHEGDWSGTYTRDQMQAAVVRLDAMDRRMAQQ